MQGFNKWISEKLSEGGNANGHLFFEPTFASAYAHHRVCCPSSFLLFAQHTYLPAYL